MATTVSGKVPAWKRLGLQLKGPGAESTPAFANPTTQNTPQAALGKRKHEDGSGSWGGAAAKTPRKDYSATAGPGAALRRQKSVTFSSDTKTSTGHNAVHSTPRPNGGAVSDTTPSKTAKKSKKKSKPAADKAQAAPPDLKSALEYLRHWRSSRDSWKFNKNHQTMLIKYVFDNSLVPTADIDAFYDYIRDIKGFVRTRLRETATEVRDKDAGAQGADGFPAGTKDVSSKQETYDAVLAKLPTGSASLGSKRKQFNEQQFTAEAEKNKDDEVVTRRVVKRMRAELIVDELADNGEGEAVSQKEAPAAEDVVDESDSKRAKLNDGRRAPRARKSRVVNIEDSSSSEDDTSDDDSDDSDDDDDDDSSSSSSSSSSGESSSESENGDGNNEEGNDDDSSSLDSSDDEGGVPVPVAAATGQEEEDDSSDSSSSSSSSDEED